MARFSRKDAGRISRTVVDSEKARRGFLLQGVRGAENNRTDGKVWESWKNNETGQDCPAYGFIELGTPEFNTATDNVILYTGVRPTGDFTLPHAINGISEVKAEGYGGLTLEPLVEGLYDTAATPNFGETWGPATNSWKLTKDRPGFTILGGIDLDKTTVRALRQDVVQILAKSPAGGIPARVGIGPGSASCDIWRRDTSGDLVAAGFSKTAKNLSDQAVAVTAFLILDRIGNDWWANYEDC